MHRYHLKSHASPRDPRLAVRRPGGLSLLRLLLLAVAVTARVGVQAQDSPDDRSEARSLRLPTSNLVQQSVEQLREQIRTDQPGQAADTLRRLSTANPILLLQSNEPNLIVPLYRILEEEFERLPETARDSIRQGGNQPSRSAIDQAIRKEQWKDLVPVMHQFPGTDGARLARLLLAQAHLDRGNELAAEHWLLPLANLPSLSTELRAAADKLQRLIKFRKQQTTNDEASNSATVRPSTSEWHVRWKQQENVASQIHLLIENSLFASDDSAVPSWNAAIRDGRLFRRTLRGLAAFDLHTGTPIWAYRLTPNHLHYLNGIPGYDSADANDITELDSSSVSMLLHDGALNTVHAGRQAVYTVVAQQTTGRPSIRMGEGAQRKRSQLVAVSRDDGRRQWTIGGPPLEPQFPIALSDTWFAGPPVASGSLLYGIVEQESEIRLVTVKQSTGELLDSTVLAFPDTTVGLDASRGLIAAAPVAVGGLILCPTTTGWLIAVDQLTHTIVWASRTTQPDDDQDDSDQDNARFMFMMARDSEGHAPRTDIHVFGNSAVVAPWASKKLTFLNIASGSGMQRPQNESRIVAVTADSLIVGADEDSGLHRLDVASQDIIWECHIPEHHGLPQGTGVVQAGQIAVGTSTGALLTLDVETGAIVSVTPDMLPPTVPGALFDAGSEAVDDTKTAVRNLVFITPDETICLTTEQDLPDSQETSARVARLVRNHEYEQAWEILAPLPEKAFEEDRELARRRFDAAFGLTVTRSLPGDVNLQDVAVTARHRRLADVVEISKSFAEQPRSAASAAIELAIKPLSWQAVIPTTLLVNSDQAASLSEQALLSTGSWAAHLIEHALNRDETLADDGAFTEKLRTVPSEILAQIHHRASTHVLRSRLMEVEDPEQALHLLVQLTRRASHSDTSTSESNPLPELTEVTSWQNLFAEIDQLQNPTARRLAVQRILLAVGDEERTALLPVVPDDIHAQDDARSGWDESWVDDDYSVIPFARPQPSRRSAVELQPADDRDPALSALTFKLNRNPERLTVHSAAPDSSQIWSVTGSLPVDTGTVASTQISRFGSIALLHSAAHLVAVSLFNQRVLWQHQSLVSEQRTRLETPVRPAHHELPPEYPGLIVPQGKAFDWICLRNQESIQIVDALTGLDRWTFPLSVEDPGSRVVVDDTYILVAINDSVMALDPRFGTQIPHQTTRDEFEEVICSVDGHLVVRKPSDDESELHLIWKNPLTGETVRTQEINHASRIQQLASARLAVIHENRDVTMVDLTTGELQPLPWLEPATSKSPSFKWNAERMTYLEDAEYVYLIHQPTVRQMRGRIPNRRMTAFTGIRVLDRQTGEHLWEYVVPNGESGRAITDQLSLPFLATIQRPFDAKTRKPLGWIRFRAFNKRTGKQLVDNRLPMRFSFGELQINAEPNHSIDLTIHGSHVRFERPGFPGIRRPGQ